MASGSKTYGVIDSSDWRSGGSSQGASPRQASQASKDRRSPISASQERPWKPSAMRRVSSKPYRGQEFSVDDGLTELEEESTLRKSTNPSSQRPPLGVRQGSNVRWKSKVQKSPSLAPTSLNSPGFMSSKSSRYTDNILGPTDSEIDNGKNDSDNGEGNGYDNDVQREDNNDEDKSNLSDAESFTLKDRQQAINETHPFGIRIWKPALYKKFRSIERTTEGDIHSAPGERVSYWLFIVNILWTLLFGWWLALASLSACLVCSACGFFPDATAYGRIFFGLSGYLFYPFGSFVLLESDENYAAEDEGEGRSISEYERWQSGDLEHGRLFFGPISNRSLMGRRRNSLDSASERDSLLERPRYHSEDSMNATPKSKRRFFGRGEWTIGRVLFYSFFYGLVGPLLLITSFICWMLVFWIPMGRVTLILFRHLRRHPLALSFNSDSTYTRSPSRSSSSILLCTYRAAGLKYWKYTVDGTNIFFINLVGVVLFTIFDYFVIAGLLGLDTWLTHPGLLFTLSLLSVIPLAYFIGQAVASISAQSSMGLGAAVNAFFSTIVEVYLYCVALSEGKSQLVEGSVIGSIFAGMLFLPGLSMCFGAIRRKTQRFNVKSAGVTSTMLFFAVIAAFGPTLFYQVYGTHELICHTCIGLEIENPADCRRCYFSQYPAPNDPFFLKSVQPYSIFAAALLFLSYIIGLWFTLRTHAAVIWSTDDDKKQILPNESITSILSNKHQAPSNGKHNFVAPSSENSIQNSQLYTRILAQSLKQVGIGREISENQLEPFGSSTTVSDTPHVVPPRESIKTSDIIRFPGLSKEQNEIFVRRVAEMAATAAAVAARDVTRQRRLINSARPSDNKSNMVIGGTNPLEEDEVGAVTEATAPAGGHDAPNWGKVKSSVILLGATLLYAIVAEILVKTVDVVLHSVDVKEKFLGITLFALVPNTTEFLNAISFAMNGNIALSMEIGSAYALQVCLLQIPALVFFSVIHSQYVQPGKFLAHSFNLIFPQWDMITVILCVFLLSYVHSEGKSNYFKGSILVLTYVFVITGFYLSGYNTIVAFTFGRMDT